MNKKTIMLFVFIFGTAGAFLPLLFKLDDELGLWSILGGLIGGLFGIWLGVWIAKRF